MTTDPFGSGDGSQVYKRGEKNVLFCIIWNVFRRKHFPKNLKTKYCEQTDKGNVNIHLLLCKNIYCIQFSGEMK